MLFPEWAPGTHDRAEARGAAYYRFPAPEGRERARLVASWSSTEVDVDALIKALKP
jgi:threonine aldolase